MKDKIEEKNLHLANELRVVVVHRLVRAVLLWASIVLAAGSVFGAMDIGNHHGSFAAAMFLFGFNLVGLGLIIAREFMPRPNDESRDRRP